MPLPLPPSLPPLPSLTAIARMKARGPPALDTVEQEQEGEEATPAGLLQDLSLNDPPSDAVREDDVEEEEQYVKVCM